MEAQAEPWEPDLLGYTDAPLSRSIQPRGAMTVVAQLRELGFDPIMLRGVEHWYMRRVGHRASSWWDSMLGFCPPVVAEQPAPGARKAALPLIVTAARRAAVHRRQSEQGLRVRPWSTRSPGAPTSWRP